MLNHLRISKSKSLPLIVVIALFLFAISGSKKSFLPVVTKDSGTAVVEGCHEQASHSTLKKLVQNVFEKSEEDDCCETICFCCNTNLKRNIQFVLVKSGLINVNQKAELFKNPEKLRLNQNIFGAFNNKSPPYFLS